MPIHDWTRVEAGVFHGFHHRWIGRLAEALTARLGPTYYAEAEQHADTHVADVLTLERPTGASGPASPRPPRLASAAPVATLRRTSVRRPRPQFKPKHVVIRHVSGHRVVALVEIVSPANKDRRRHAEAFEGKVIEAIRAEVHVAVVDLFPPTRWAPNGLPAFSWRRYDRSDVTLPTDQPLSLGSFRAVRRPEAFFEFRGVAEELPALPLYLTPSRWVPLPLADTYDATFAASPPYLRELLSAPPAPGA